MAAETANKRTLALLLYAGADANAKMENGSTALHVLASRSAGRWRKDGDGDGGTDEAELRRRFVECANILIKEASPPANFDATNNIGVTPIKMAAEKGSEVVS